MPGHHRLHPTPRVRAPGLPFFTSSASGPTGGKRAASISDPGWRAIATDKLANEQFNAQVAATLATLAPRRLRPTAIRAIVAAEVLYDYLDGASEQAAPAGRHLYDAFATALGRHRHDAAHYYADLPTDDGGYLHQLALACRDALGQLPAAAEVRDAAWTAAERCASAQDLTHRIDAEGVRPLMRWSELDAAELDLAWWEYAAGGAASILAIQALVAAANPETTPPNAPHHVMTVAGVSAYYLSAADADSHGAERTSAAVSAALGPVLRPVLAIFAAWRAAKRRRAASVVVARRHTRRPVSRRSRVALRARSGGQRWPLRRWM
jgi:hypothetical protein